MAEIDNKKEAPYGPRPVYETPLLNCLIKRPEDTPITCAVCGQPLGGRILQSTQFTCDHCGRKFNMCRDCGKDGKCPVCGGWLLDSWETAGKWLLRIREAKAKGHPIKDHNHPHFESQESTDSE